MRTIFPNPGSDRDPNNFVGRAKLFEEVGRQLSRGANLQLTDPRRMGKTFFLKTFAARTEDYDVVIIDYEGVDTREKFLLHSVKALAEHQSLSGRAKDLFGHLFDRIGEVGLGPVSVKLSLRTVDPSDLFDKTIEVVSAARVAASKPLVVCMDETPIALQNIARAESTHAARALLQTLRRARQNFPIQWIVCGSIGFHHVLNRLDATEADVNDLLPIPLGPLPPDEAPELVDRLLLGIGREASDEARQRLVELSGGIPFLIHSLAHSLDTGGLTLTVAEVDTAFEAFVSDRGTSGSMTHLLTRIESHYEHRKEVAYRILDATAVTNGIAVSDLRVDTTGDIESVIDLLVDDHYLTERSGVLAWRYDVLREVWRRRRRLGA